MAMYELLHTLEELREREIISYTFYDWLGKNGFKTAPASTKYHGAFEGGLFEHSRTVMEQLVNLTNDLNLKWENPRSPYIVGMFHDLCKIDAYKKPLDEVVLPLSQPYIYNEDVILKGHGEKSVMLLSQFMSLTEEEILCIRYHMGAYEKDDWKGFDLAIKKYPNVLFTHTADMLASKLAT